MRTMTITQFKEAYKKFLAGVGNDLTNELVRAAPVDTGFLRNAIRYEVKGKGVEITMPLYGFFLEMGTVPHEIRAKDGGVLHWKKGGKDYFAKVVHHPGTQPQPWIRPVLNTKLKGIIASNLRRQFT